MKWRSRMAFGVGGDGVRGDWFEYVVTVQAGCQPGTWSAVILPGRPLRAGGVLETHMSVAVGDGGHQEALAAAERHLAKQHAGLERRIGTPELVERA